MENKHAVNLVVTVQLVRSPSPSSSSAALSYLILLALEVKSKLAASRLIGRFPITHLSKLPSSPPAAVYISLVTASKRWRLSRPMVTSQISRIAPLHICFMYSSSKVQVEVRRSVKLPIH